MPALSRPSPSVLRIAGAAALVACFLLLALRHVYGQDATYDERFYFGVGRAILRQGTWDGVMLLHPPLSYYVASLPLLAVPGEVSAHHPRQLLLCRLTSLLAFGLPLLLIVRAWAQRLHGPAAGLFALALAAFSPTLLAHAPLITPDVALAATGLLTFYLYWRAGPDGRVWPWGLALGLALLTKVSAVLFAAALVVLELWRWRARGASRVLRRLAAALALAWLVLNAGYGFAGLFDVQGKAAMLAKVPPLPGLRLAAHAAAPFFPLPYLRCIGRQAHIGMDGRPSYLLGEVSTEGWWHYYLVALAVKETLPFLLLLAAALVSLSWLRPSPRDEPALLLPPLLFFVFFSMGAIQIGIRYVLPALPFLFVFCARVLRLPWAARPAFKPAVAALLLGHAVLSARGGPDYLAYFNELAGGPAGGWRYLGDSNLDWGQNRSRAEDYARRTGAAFEPLVVPPHGRVVLSTNRVQGFMDPPRYRLLRDEYAPTHRVAWNWFVYDLDRGRRFPADSMLSFVSGPEWRTGDPAGDWTQPGFDARSWSPAVVTAEDGLPLPDAFPGTSAQVMTCAHGAPRCGFSLAFDLGASPAQAVIYLASRGGYQLHVNGRLAAAGSGCRAEYRVESARLTRALRAGANLLALQVEACGEASPRVLLEMRVARG
jgi:4-amino-4-deoxy-L-arabinose transferase-like glycosyltransferase